jgi:hypothetical protein
MESIVLRNNIPTESIVEIISSMEAIVEIIYKEEFEDTKGAIRMYIEEEETTPWPKEKVQKDKERSAKVTHKTKD